MKSLGKYLIVLLIGIFLGYLMGRKEDNFNAKLPKEELSLFSEKVPFLDLTSSPYYGIIMCDKEKLLDIYESLLKYGYDPSINSSGVSKYRSELYDKYIKHCDSSGGWYVDPENIEKGLIRNLRSE